MLHYLFITINKNLGRPFIRASNKGSMPRLALLYIHVEVCPGWVIRIKCYSEITSKDFTNLKIEKKKTWLLAQIKKILFHKNMFEISFFLDECAQNTLIDVLTPSKHSILQFSFLLYICAQNE